MKKILVFFLILFVTSGCDVKYDLTIDKDTYKETVNIIEQNNNNLELTNKTMFEIYLKKPIPLSKESVIQSESNEKVPGVEYYEKTNLSSGFQTGMELKGKFNDETYNLSNLVSFAYGTLNVEKSEDSIKYSTNEKAKIFEQYENLNTLTVNIKSNLKVLDHNADEKKGNVYIWNINRGNYLNKPIYIEMEYEDSIVSFTKQLFIGAVFIFMIGLIVFLFINHKNKQNNVI